MHYGYAFEFEDTHIACFVTITSLVIRDNVGLVESVYIYNFLNQNDAVSCAALEIVFASGLMVFLDTLSFDGISIGAEREKASWMRAKKDYTVTQL